VTRHVGRRLRQVLRGGGRGGRRGVRSCRRGGSGGGRRCRGHRKRLRLRSGGRVRARTRVVGAGLRQRGCDRDGSGRRGAAAGGGRREVAEGQGADDGDSREASRRGDSARERAAPVRMAGAVDVASGCRGIAVLVEEVGLGGRAAAEEHGAWRGMCTRSGPRTAGVGGGSRRSWGRGLRSVARRGRQAILRAAAGLAHPDH
jgi:hypothetical protein